MKIVSLTQCDIKEVATWPLGMKMGVIGLVCVVTVFLGYWSVLMPIGAENVALKKKGEVLARNYEEKKTKAHHQVNNPNPLVLRNTHPFLQRQIPLKDSLVQCVEMISQAAGDAGLLLSSIRLLDEKQVIDFIEVPIDLAAQGRYAQVVNFIQQLKGQTNLVIPSLMLAKKKDIDEEGALIMTMKISLYFQRGSTQHG